METGYMLKDIELQKKNNTNTKLQKMRETANEKIKEITNITHTNNYDFLCFCMFSTRRIT